jgi:penicillin-binding protein 1A
MQGASTITQQVAKNMLVGSDRTVLRKAREALLSLRIEQALSKPRILELYLNEIFLGAQAYGVAAAAQAYFNKSLDELSVGETAFLAALPKGPNNYNPLRFPEPARIRRDWVIERMAEDGVITTAEATAAKAEPLVARLTRRPETVAVGGHYTEEVRRELISRFGAEQTQGGGLVVRTSLDPVLQAQTEVALRNGLMAFDRRRGGWRGALAKIDAAPTAWLPALDALPPTPGQLSTWQRGVVLEVRPNEARLGFIERPNPRAPAEPRTATLPFADLGWARPALPTQPGQAIRLGPAPRRMSDVLAVGDVVLFEREPARPAEGRTPARAERITLRQIPEVEGAVVALDPNTGRVLAMTGGWSYERSQFNRASQAQRQPGSSFKPYVYLAALENGIPPNQRFLDAAVEVNTPQGIWRPGNYDRTASGGTVSMRSAMERSLNLVTVRIAQEVGMDKVSDIAARLGVIENMPRFLAMSLGAGETTVLRQAAGYASFVNGGRRVEPSFIDSVQDQRGRVLWRNGARACEGCDGGPDGEVPRVADNRRQAIDPIAAYQMVSILQGAVQFGTGTRAGAGLGRPVAGKTGTTDDYRDNWFVGFTPDIVVAVWLGYDEPRTLGRDETGGNNAAPIFNEVVAAALQGSPAVPFRAPPGVALVRISGDNGRTFTEAFRPGTENSARAAIGVAAEGRGTGTAAAAQQVDTGLGGLY